MKIPSGASKDLRESPSRNFTPIPIIFVSPSMIFIDPWRRSWISVPISRIPGARPASYKDIPRLLDKYKIIPADFANQALAKMAGYRNRMVHFYGEISERELHAIIQEELDDLYIFIGLVEKVLKDPAKFSLQTG